MPFPNLEDLEKLIPKPYWVVWKAPLNEHKRCPEGYLDDGKWHCFGEDDPGGMAWLLSYFQIAFYIFEPSFTSGQALAEAKRQHEMQIKARALPQPEAVCGKTLRLF